MGDEEVRRGGIAEPVGRGLVGGIEEAPIAFGAFEPDERRHGHPASRSRFIRATLPGTAHSLTLTRGSMNP